MQKFILCILEDIFRNRMTMPPSKRFSVSEDDEDDKMKKKGKTRKNIIVVKR